MNKIVELEDMEVNETSSRHHFVRTSGRYDGWFNRCYTPTVGKLLLGFNPNNVD